jgi:hypothetical protein
VSYNATSSTTVEPLSPSGNTILGRPLLIEIGIGGGCLIAAASLLSYQSTTAFSKKDEADLETKVI